MLSEFTSDTRLLVSTEWGDDVETSSVDLHLTRTNLSCHFESLLIGRGPDASRESVVGVIRNGDRLFFGVVGNDRCV